MSDETTSPEPEADRASTPREPLEPHRSLARRHWGKLTVAAVVLVPVLVFWLWATLALSYSYSTGERVGYVQKISLKGWLCKTWEGELQMSNIPGSAPILFEFSVRSDSLAHEIERTAGRAVSLTYEQHVGVPTTCFGETEYFVTKVREVTR